MAGASAQCDGRVGMRGALVGAWAVDRRRTFGYAHALEHSLAMHTRAHSRISWRSDANAHTPASDDGHKIQVSDAGCEYRRGTACEPSPCERGRRRGLHIPGFDAPKFTILVHAGSAGGAERSGRRWHQVALCYADNICLQHKGYMQVYFFAATEPTSGRRRHRAAALCCNLMQE